MEQSAHGGQARLSFSFQAEIAPSWPHVLARRMRAGKKEMRVGCVDGKNHRGESYLRQNGCVCGKFRKIKLMKLLFIELF